MSAQSDEDRSKLLKANLFAYLRANEDRFAAHTDEQLGKTIFLNSLTLRLRKEGWIVLKRHFECEVFEVDKDERLSGKDLIALRKKMVWPYFLSQNKIYLFSAKDIFLLRLHGDNLKKWLKKMHD